MQELTLKQAFNLAGIDASDSDMERDIKFLAWIGQRKYRIVGLDRYQQEREWAIDDAVDILIIKE